MSDTNATAYDNSYSYENYYQTQNPGFQQRVVGNVYLTKPARRQVKPGSGPGRPEFTHHSSDYNIWYHKKLGDRFAKEDRVKALTRCCVATDAGYTRADKMKKDTYMCLYFARGHCANGAECSYYHRIPTEEDELRIDVTHDVFGREKHRAYREDMGGVGSFLRDNRTLYVSNIKRTSDMEEIVKRHFAEWGEMECVKVVWDKSLAFVKYNLRVSAEFAKEAMQDQSLDHDEVLNVRWSNEDPNPATKEEEEQRTFLRTAKLAALKQKKEESQYQYQNTGYQLDYYPSSYNGYSYPSTDNQYYNNSNLIQGTDYSKSQQIVEDWLKSIELTQYKDSFISSGYLDLNMIAQIDEYALDAIGVEDIDHRVAILENVEKLQQEQQEKQEKGENGTGEQQEEDQQYQQQQYSEYEAYYYNYYNNYYNYYGAQEDSSAATGVHSSKTDNGNGNVNKRGKGSGNDPKKQNKKQRSNANVPYPQ